MRIKTGDRRFDERKRFDTLPEGYTIRRLVHGISPGTTRKLTDGAQSALYEIASATPAWTEWGFGHATSMYSGACERRGYIEVAVPDNPSRGHYLYRATRDGVLLANKWRKLRGEEPLPVPGGHVHEYGKWEHPGPLFLTSERRYCACGSFESRMIEPEPEPEPERVEAMADAASFRGDSMGARGEEWPENLDVWELYDAIRVEPDSDRLRMLNAELQARFDAAAPVATQRVAP